MRSGNTPLTGPGAHRQPQRQRITLGQYVRRRNGVPLGSSGSLRYMLHRSLGAGSFAGFWQHWNPVWGYGLARYVYSPLRRVLPQTAALLSTFMVCGALHDLAILIVRGFLTFLFVPWFFLLGVVMILGDTAAMNFSSRPWLVRAFVNFTYVSACLAVTLLARRFLGIS